MTLDENSKEGVRHPPSLINSSVQSFLLQNESVTGIHIQI